MKKPTIAIDIDDVLADEKSAIRMFMNQHYQLNLTREDYEIDAPYWGYWQTVWGVDTAVGEEMLRAYFDSGAPAQYQIVPNATQVIGELTSQYKLAIITSRENSMVDSTHRWLEAHFPQVFEHVEFVDVWGGKAKVTKGAIANHLGASYLLDDNLEHCSLALEAGVQPLLFGDYGWNRSPSLALEIVRVRDWLAVKEYFDARA